jgi:hypothetical protein
MAVHGMCTSLLASAPIEHSPIPAAAMNKGDIIHHIVFSYGIIEMVLNEQECLAYFEEYEGRDLEPMYQEMEVIYGRSFERIPHKGLNLVEAKDFHNCTANSAN